jgi:probable rRNA maturation factor
MAEVCTVDVQVASSSRSVPADDVVGSWVTTVLEELDFNDNVEVSVRVVDEDESRHLNKTFRGKDKPTNVLSFPSGIGDYLPGDEQRPLGDIVICAPVVEQEAAAQGKSLDDHWAHLVVHGTLHLLGFDHETDADAMEMESVEREILASRGIPDPYLS